MAILQNDSTQLPEVNTLHTKEKLFNRAAGFLRLFHAPTLSLREKWNDLIAPLTLNFLACNGNKSEQTQKNELPNRSC